MDISTSLLAKGAAGALAATAAVGTGVAAKEGFFGDLFGANNELEDGQRVENLKEEKPETTVNNSLEGSAVPTGTEGTPEGEKISADGSAGGLAPTVESDLAEGTPSMGSGNHEDTVNQRATGGNENAHEEAGTEHKTKTTKKKTDLTKFDQGLIDFLKAGGDIVFDVKRGETNEDFTEENLTFDSSKTSPLTARVIVSIDGGDANLKEKDGNTDEKGKKETLKNLNGGGTQWTWSCKVKFKTTETSLTGKTINNKEKIFSSTGEEGLFNILKKDFSNGGNDATKEKGKKTKEEFIKSCAKERGTKNKSVDTNGIPSTDNNDLKSEIKINLKLGVAGQADKTDGNKLYPSESEDDKKFKELFDEITGQIIPTA